MNEIVAVFHYSLYTQLYFYFWVFVFGAVVGSFLNVVVFRLFSGESIVLPPSHCNSCGAKIKWYDNIPIFSYFVLLRGRCRNCKEKISIQYPIVEFICAILFLLIFMKYEFSWQTLFLMYFGAAAIVMSATDFKEKVVFDIVSVPVIPIGLFYSFFNIAHNDVVNFIFFNILIPESFISSVAAIIAAFLFFEGSSLISKIFLGHRAFGDGDTVISMGIGAWFGFKVFIITLVLAIFIQVISSIPIMFYEFYKNKDKDGLITLSGLLACVFVPLIVNFFGFMKIWIAALCFTVIFLGIALLLSFNFLKKLRNREMSPTFLPFGPALLFSTILTVAFYPIFIKIVNLYFNFI